MMLTLKAHLPSYATVHILGLQALPSFSWKKNSVLYDSNNPIKFLFAILSHSILHEQTQMGPHSVWVEDKAKCVK